MAQLVSCPLCERKVSDETYSCPGCGHNVRDALYESRKKQWQLSVEALEMKGKYERAKHISDKWEEDGLCRRCGERNNITYTHVGFPAVAYPQTSCSMDCGSTPHCPLCKSILVKKSVPYHDSYSYDFCNSCSYYFWSSPYDDYYK